MNHFQTIYLPRPSEAVHHGDDTMYTRIKVGPNNTFYNNSYLLNMNSSPELLKLVHHTPYPKSLSLQNLIFDKDPYLYFKALFDDAPITKLSLDDVQVQPVDGLVNKDNSILFQALTLIPRLTHLKFKFFKFTKKDLGALHWLLLSSDTLKSLTLSFVSFKKVECLDMIMFYHGIEHSKLERLCIKKCEYLDEICISIVVKNKTTLRELEIYDDNTCEIYPVNLRNLLYNVATHPTLKKVTVDCVNITFPNIRDTFYSSLLANTTLEELTVDEGSVLLANKNGPLVKLLKRNDNLKIYNETFFISTDLGLSRLFDLYNSCRLRNLSLEIDNTDGLDLSSLAEFVSSNTTIEDLSLDVTLDNNKAGGLRLVHAVAKNTTLRTLKFSENREGHHSVRLTKRLLIDLANNTTLTKLTLKGVDSYRKIGRELVRFLKTNTTLVKLYAKRIFRDYDAGTIKDIINALAVNTTLQTLKCMSLYTAIEEFDEARANFITNNTTLVEGSESLLALDNITENGYCQMKLRNHALNLSLFNLLLPIASTFE